MNQLSRLQKSMQQAILAGDQNILGELNGSPIINAELRLPIYVDGYRVRLVEALAHDFPVLRELAGKQIFESLARAYIATHPSQHFSIRYFGSHLSQFLANAQIDDIHPAWEEMAAFEWALGEALDAADAPIVTPDNIKTLAQSEWPHMQFALHPSTRCLSLEWNVPTLWNDHQQRRALSPLVRVQEPTTWLIWRHGIEIYFRSLDRPESWAINAAQKGFHFAAICAGLCQWLDADLVAKRAAEMVATWINDGLITAISELNLEIA